jgi:Fe-S oxidoreductase
MKNIKKTGADAVIAPNPGCIIQLRSGMKRYNMNVEVFHIVELLDQAYHKFEFSHSSLAIRLSND